MSKSRPGYSKDLETGPCESRRRWGLETFAQFLPAAREGARCFSGPFLPRTLERRTASYSLTGNMVWDREEEEMVSIKVLAAVVVLAAATVAAAARAEPGTESEPDGCGRPGVGHR